MKTLALLCVAACASDGVTEGFAEVSPSPNDEIAFRFFVDHGLTDTQAAGMIGNLDAESSMDPRSVEPNGPGRGIAQWSEGARWATLQQFAADRGRDPWALDLQLDYAWFELASFPQFGLAALLGATTIEDATIIVQNNFEVCGECRPERRLAFAQAAFAAYGGRGGAYAFQANTHELWTQHGPTGLGMMPTTSPSLAGGHIAFQANTGNLFVDGVDQHLGMAAGTSPAIAVSGHVAFQANTGRLFIGGIDQQLGMAPGASPAIALVGGSLVVAFQANTNELWINGRPTGLGMAAETSPAIASTGTVAFQANTGELWIAGAPTGLGMAPRTSPSIAARAGGGIRFAFQANDHELWVDGHGTGLGMMPGTSPSIDPDGTVVFQANDGNLWRLGASGAHSLSLGMAPGSSPAN